MIGRLMKLLVRLYPTSSRNRYEAEFAALLEEVQPSWRSSFNILTGAIAMQLRLASLTKILAFTGVLGLLTGVFLLVILPREYASQSIILIKSIKPLSIEEAGNAVKHSIQMALSDSALTRIINEYKLYPAKASKMPLSVIVREMKENITIEPISRPGSSGTQFSMRFSYGDPVIAQDVTDRLTSQLLGNLLEDAVTKESIGVAMPVMLELIDPARLDTAPIRPNPKVLCILGLVGGLTIGLVFALFRRSPKPA